MLVSVEDNGYRAYASFQTHVLLMHAQLQYLDFFEVDLNAEPPSPLLPSNGLTTRQLRHCEENMHAHIYSFAY